MQSFSQYSGGGALGASAPPLFVPGEKVPFFGNESALFSWSRSAVLAKLKCPFWSVPPHFRGASAASDLYCPKRYSPHEQ